MRLLLLLGTGLLAAAVLAACGGGGGDGNGDGGEGESSLEQALRRMVLQADDLPEGFVLGEESLITNEELASSSDDPQARKVLLEEWGRLLGYEVTYDPTGSALEESPVQGINVSASLYRTEEGASKSFDDAVKKAEETDWPANYTGLRHFRQEEVDYSGPADEIVWLRFSGFQPVEGGPNPLVTDDLIFFRVAQERGFLLVRATSTDTEDRQHLIPTVKGWLRTLIENVEEVLADPGFEVEEE